MDTTTEGTPTGRAPDADSGADVVRFLRERREGIVAEAVASMGRAHLPHYRTAGDVARKVSALFDLLVGCLAERDLGPMVAYSRRVADERYEAGFDLSEVQRAFNVLEESTWRAILDAIDPQDFATTIGLVTTVLGAGKDALAREYVSAATKTHAPSLNLTRLFDGTEGV